MFDGIYAIITLLVDVLNLNSSIIFKTLQNINLVFAVHLINRANGKCFYKFPIVREPAAIRSGI